MIESVNRDGERTAALSFGKAVVVLAFLCAFGMGLSVMLPRWLDGRASMFECLGISVVGALVIGLVFLALAWLLGRLRLPVPAHRKPAFEHGFAFGFACFAIMSLVFVVSLLSVYPGYAGNDSMDIIRQATGQYQHTDSFRYDGLSNHHPILYTLLVRAVFAATSVFGASLQVSTFCFLLLQALLFAVGCAWALAWWNRHGAGRIYLVIALLLLALVPLYAVHAITFWKDGLFSVSVLVTSLLAFGLMLNSKHGALDYLCFALACMLTALLRNNGIFLDAALLIWVLIVVPETRKAVAACLVAVATCFAVVQGPVYAQLQVESGHFSESVGIPIQQIGLTAIEGGLDAQDEQFIAQILPLKNWKDDYETFESNGIKFDPAFNDAFLESHKLKFIGVWAHVVATNPGTAFRAWWQVVGGFMTPGEYAAIGTKGTVENAKTTDLLGFGWNPRDAFNKVQKKFPYVLGKGTIVWLGLWLSLLAIALRSERRFAGSVPFIPYLALLATMLIASPSGWDYRYVFPFALMLPFLPFFIGEALRSHQQAFASEEDETSPNM